MTVNYHTHTFRCGHADGTEREYIENAVAAGFTTLGFSDHVPYPFPEGYISGFRMQIDTLDDYFTTLRCLQEEFKDRIRILIGFEAEYYPEYFDKMLSLIGAYDYDYLILGQHYLENELSHKYNGAETKDEERLRAYVDQVIEGLNTGKFLYLAHPDLIHYTGPDDIFVKHAKRLCNEAKKLNIPLEINLLGLSSGNHYPSKRFFDVAARIGNKVIFGVDAHTPEVFLNKKLFEKAEEFARAAGLKPLESLEI